MTTKANTLPPLPPQSPLTTLAAHAAGMLAVMTLITGVAYPLAITGIAQGLLHDKANGSLIVKDGKVLGSQLIGQPFEDPKHFWGRLSATTPAAYNAGASTGSNLGPLNEALTKNVKARIDALRAADPEATGPVPIDLVTSSASGLDPHISPAAAEYQVRRVARARGMSEDRVRALVGEHTEGRDLGILGEPRVNVLLLNLALDGTYALEEFREDL
jgi:K+-transporting ATPase ATPase C chain